MTTLPLMLASASPRRKELIERMGIALTTHPQEIDETFLSRHPLKEARRIARLKVEALLENEGDTEARWVLGADTFIAKGNTLLGKPENRGEAEQMLRRLSGKSHKVITGMSLHIPGESHLKTVAVTTTVVFNRLSAADIEWYLDSGEWQDAAGAYKIQGAGSCLIKKIIGSYPNVMGLPIETLYGILSRYNFPL